MRSHLYFWINRYSTHVNVGDENNFPMNPLLIKLEIERRCVIVRLDIAGLYLALDVHLPSLINNRLLWTVTIEPSLRIMWWSLTQVSLFCLVNAYIGYFYFCTNLCPLFASLANLIRPDYASLMAERLMLIFSGFGLVIYGDFTSV